MKRGLFTIPALVLAVGMYLGILLGLVRVTIAIGEIPAGPMHALARCGELAAGIILLLGSTNVTTRMAVWLFRAEPVPSR